jgi:hypothetical protein
VLIAPHDTRHIAGVLPAVAADAHPFRQRFVEIARAEQLATPWELETFMNEISQGADGLPDILATLADPDDLVTITRAFDSADADAIRWGFLSWSTPEVPTCLNDFTVACRKAGITPSLILLQFLAAFLVQGHHDGALE